MKLLLVPLGLAIVAVALAQDLEGSEGDFEPVKGFHRQKKLLGTTETKSTTISTSTLCWTSVAGQITNGNCNRKRKAIIQTPLLGQRAVDVYEYLSPSKPVEKTEEQDQLDGSELQKQDLNMVRHPKFLFYVYTTTTTSTFTTFTATATVTYHDCTPDVSLIQACG